MERATRSSKSDGVENQSPKGDIPETLFDVLRNARRSRNLSQEALAAKLGLRQRQISDLERATKDPRLSTILNVARALDLELMLIPRHLIAAVEGLQRSTAGAGKQPMYALGNDEAES